MKVTRIHADESGITRFDEVEIPLADAGPIGRLSSPVGAESVIFRETGADYDYDWHPAPARQLVVLLDGEIEIEVGTGDVGRFAGGEVLLLTDPIDSFWPTMSTEWEGKPFRSVTQGAADLSEIPLLDDAAKPEAETAEFATFLAFVKTVLGDAVSDVKSSDRLTESAVCLVAPEHGPDRQFERLLSAAGRLDKAAAPILEINPKHERIAALSRLGKEERAFREDAAHLLYDEARVLDGDKPADARAFVERLSRLTKRALPG